MLTKWTSTEDTIIDIIEPHKDFRLRKKGIRTLLRARNVLRNSRRGQLEMFEGVDYGSKSNNMW